MESPDLQVHFCDLCNASVPLQDLESGAARRHQGRTFGACCLGALREPGSAAAVPATPAAPAPVLMPMAPSRHGAEPRVLPLGIAILAGLAAATLFLESRIDQAETRWLGESGQQADALRTQAEGVQGILVALDSAARRTDIDRLQERLAAAEQAQQRSSEVADAAAKEQAKALAVLQAGVTALQEAERRRVDPAPALAEMSTRIQQALVGLAELQAQPRPAQVVPEAVPMPPAPTGLQPELAHQVAKLKDEDAATRFEAVDVLLRSRDPLVLEHLLPMTKDADTFVRRLCVEGIKDFRQAAVVDALLVALADPEEIVRDTAWRSLKDLTGQKLPFEAGAARDVRARAQQKWQEWWDKNRDSFGT